LAVPYKSVGGTYQIPLTVHKLYVDGTNLFTADGRGKTAIAFFYDRQRCYSTIRQRSFLPLAVTFLSAGGHR